MEAAPVSQLLRDECYRCGYDLRGIADEQPCPECGLLAQRSRRATDELHNTRPKWLRKIAIGANLVLVSIVVCALGLSCLPLNRVFLFHFHGGSGWYWMDFRVGILVCTGAVMILMMGVWLLSVPEGYPPADQADRRLRRLLRLNVAVPLVMLIWFCADKQSQSGRFSFIDLRDDLMRNEFPFLWLLGGCAVVLPMLLFNQFHDLCRRARSAELARHCRMVGIGTSLSLLLSVFIAALVLGYRNLGIRDDWESNSQSFVFLMAVVVALATLFTTWSLLLLLSFALALTRAARTLRAAWIRDDRAEPH